MNLSSVEISNLQNLKNSIVAVGLVNENDTKKLILGTGFFFNSKGFAVTATHVYLGLEEIKNEYLKVGEKYDYALFQNHYDGSKVNLDTIRFYNKKHLNLKNRIGTSPDFLDVSVLLPEGISGTLPINIQTPTRNQLYNKIIICGYPGGLHSFSENETIGIKFSPVMQFGRFTGLFPFDDFPTPWGIQTDIIGTGGSSGSPIIDLTNFKVIGIAQNVIPSQVSVNYSENELNGSAKVGLIYGLSSYYFYDVDNLITGHENELDINYDRDIYSFEPIQEK